MSTLNNLLDAASLEDSSPPTGSSQPASELFISDDPGVPQTSLSRTDSQIEEEEEGEDNFDMSSIPNKPPLKPQDSSLFVMGNKARTNGRDTQFYQVLNVSETWHRNHTLSKKEDQKLLFTGELLSETLSGYGYIAVEIYDVKGLKDIKFRVRVKKTDLVKTVKKSICELVEVEDGEKLSLWVEGKRLEEEEEICKEIGKLSEHNWARPYFGLVWVCPK